MTKGTKSSVSGGEFFKIAAGEHQYEPGPNGLALYYANHARVTVSAEDACITFGVRDIDAPGTVRQDVRVYMSLAHTKRLLEALGGMLGKVEAEIGTIDPQPARKLIQTAEGGRGDDKGN